MKRRNTLESTILWHLACSSFPAVLVIMAKRTLINSQKQLYFSWYYAALINWKLRFNRLICEPVFSEMTLKRISLQSYYHILKLHLLTNVSIWLSSPKPFEPSDFINRLHILCKKTSNGLYNSIIKPTSCLFINRRPWSQIR